ncbi:replication protein [Ornithinibacillus contaminans]|uniref:replication protein n=1 Tax=Ornithinibacillus contaminans TaxID=694055 RepID=UPI00064D8DE8|nr:replication protein [Ornithinibacillus contaminans]
MGNGSGFGGFESPNFTQTPNDFYDEILLTKNITIAEVKILGFMIRYTYGWQRAGNSLQFSFTELQNACHLGREAVNNGLKKLLQKNYIQRKEIDGHMKYRLHIKEFSDYPWSIEFNWKNVFKPNNVQAENVDTKGEFDNRTSTSSEIEPVPVRKSNQHQFDNRTNKNSGMVEPQGTEDPLNKGLNKEIKEEEILSKRKQQLSRLERSLQEKGFNKKQTQAILSLLSTKDIDTIDSIKPSIVERQIAYMYAKMQDGEIEFHSTEGLAKYFLNGMLELMNQSEIVKIHEQEQMVSKQRKKKRDTSFYYNWLVDEEK